MSSRPTARRASQIETDWLTLGQAAQFLGVAQSTIRKWSDQGARAGVLHTRRPSPLPPARSRGIRRALVALAGVARSARARGRRRRRSPGADPREPRGRRILGSPGRERRRSARRHRRPRPGPRPARCGHAGRRRLGAPAPSRRAAWLDPGDHVQRPGRRTPRRRRARSAERAAFWASRSTPRSSSHARGNSFRSRSVRAFAHTSSRGGIRPLSRPAVRSGRLRLRAADTGPRPTGSGRMGDTVTWIAGLVLMLSSFMGWYSGSGLGV